MTDEEITELLTAALLAVMPASDSLGEWCSFTPDHFLIDCGSRRAADCPGPRLRRAMDPRLLRAMGLDQPTRGNS